VTRRALLGGLTPARFLREHWQKKPLLVRGALPGFRDPIEPDELAGLACEHGVESRIVRERGRRGRPWEVTWGPQAEETFATLPAARWTLLVQEVNRWVPDAALLLDRFDFLPNVRVDDVMVSFAAPGGSVGPHVDSYDVFLVQGQGERRWRYGTKKVQNARFRPGLELRILERFEPDADEVLGPGDMLYLPPGFAHHGTAVSPCLTYSVGFRAPNAGEMWKDLAAHLARIDPRAARLLEDPPLSPAESPGAIPEAMLRRVRAMVREAAPSDEALDRWFASFATRLAPGHELEAPRRRLDARAIGDRLREGRSVLRSEEGRWAFLPGARAGALRLYVGGAEIEVAREASALAKALASRRRFEAGEVSALAGSSGAARALLTHLFAIGALRFGPRARRARPGPRAQGARRAPASAR
jgi:50S ribosomal protein L16 3-hydroxylase